MLGHGDSGSPASALRSDGSLNARPVRVVTGSSTLRHDRGATAAVFMVAATVKGSSWPQVLMDAHMCCPGPMAAVHRLDLVENCTLPGLLHSVHNAVTQRSRRGHSSEMLSS